MENAPKRCAHCGGVPKFKRIFFIDGKQLYLECRRCFVRTRPYATAIEATVAWNTRFKDVLGELK